MIVCNVGFSLTPLIFLSRYDKLKLAKSFLGPSLQNAPCSITRCRLFLIIVVVVALMFCTFVLLSGFVYSLLFFVSSNNVTSGSPITKISPCSGGRYDQLLRNGVFETMAHCNCSLRNTLLWIVLLFRLIAICHSTMQKYYEAISVFTLSLLPPLDHKFILWKYFSYSFHKFYGLITSINELTLWSVLCCNGFPHRVIIIL